MYNAGVPEVNIYISSMLRQYSGLNRMFPRKENLPLCKLSIKNQSYHSVHCGAEGKEVEKRVNINISVKMVQQCQLGAVFHWTLHGSQAHTAG